MTTNSLQNEIEDYERLERFSGPAKRIMEKIKPLKSHVDIAKRRWFWELLQNAADYNDTVDIEIELTRESVKFRHNGNPFTYKDARNLIEPNSAKDDVTDIDKRETVGQFGTGFLATHILSLWIKVSGIIESKGQHFQFGFDLDRRGKDEKKELMSSIERSIYQLNDTKNHIPIWNYIPHKKCDTEFLYDFAFPYDFENGYSIAVYGIKTLDHILPYVFSFIPKVKSIRVLDKSQIVPTEYTFRGNEYIEIDGEKIFSVRKYDRLNSLLNEDFILLVKHGDTSVAVPIKQNELTGKYDILEYHPEIPKMFCVFPMIGTENFNFPVVINSQKFEPKTERNGIEVSAKDIINRQRMSEVLHAYIQLVDFAERNKWANLHRLCRIKEASDLDDVVRDWYKNIVTTIRSHFSSKELVETDNGRIKLSDAYIPYHNDKKQYVDQIYHLAHPLLKNKLPKSEHYAIWYEILDFQYFKNQKLDIERLLEEIQSLGNVNELAQKVGEECFNWLNKVIAFLCNTDQIYLLDRFSILPNQNGNFRVRKSLDVDEDVPEDLKTLLLELTVNRQDYKDFLLHKEVKTHSNLFDEKNKKTLLDISQEIDGTLRDFVGGKTEPIFLNAVNSLFRWINQAKQQRIISEDREKILFSWFWTNKAQIVLDTFSDENDRENAFIIVQSGKMDALAKIAQSDISGKDLELLANNIEAFKEFLNRRPVSSTNILLDDTVDDKTFVDEEIGAEGELYIFNYLVNKFGASLVEWSSKMGQAQYDFRIFKEDRSVRYYIDVKTTRRGIDNSDSIPFFMRYAQWNFLDQEESRDKYYIARLFRNGDGFRVKFLKVSMIEI